MPAPPPGPVASSAAAVASSGAAAEGLQIGGVDLGAVGVKVGEKANEALDVATEVIGSAASEGLEAAKSVATAAVGGLEEAKAVVALAWDSSGGALESAKQAANEWLSFFRSS